MYRLPTDLDISRVIGEFTTQVRVGQFDIQFTFGKVNFAIQSPVSLIRNALEIGKWSEGKWPDPAFYEMMNVRISKYDIPNDRLMILRLENGIEIHLCDSSDQYESMQISIEGKPSLIIC